MGRPEDAIPDAPVYTATMAEMENLEELLATANELAMRYGAVRIDPPAAWAQPPLRMSPKSRFFVRMQTLPAAPFVDPQLVKQANITKPHPRKRTRRKTTVAAGDDSDEPVLIAKDTKTASRDRAARAASRSQRIHPQQNQLDQKILADHIARTDFGAERTAPNPALKLPPNPTCTPATSPPPEMHVPDPRLLAKSADKPVLPSPTGQTAIAPAFPGAPYSQIQPSSTSAGQTEAVREAAQRLAEAFTGSAKAGPAPNATAIPPCPFSQQTAQEHMAKRTAEDQSPFPLVDALPLPHPVPGTETAQVIQNNNARAHVGFGRESEERVIRGGEVSHIHHDATNLNASELRREGNMQINSVRRIDTSVRPPENDARYEGYVNTVDNAGAEMLRYNVEELRTKNREAEGLPNHSKMQSAQIIAPRPPENDARNEGYVNTADNAATEMLKYNLEELRTKNSEAEDPPNHSKTQSAQIIAPSNLNFYMPQPRASPMIPSGLNSTDGSVANVMIPDSKKPFETPCDTVGSDKSHQDAKRGAPRLPFQTQVPLPNQIIPLGNITGNGTQNRNQRQHHSWTAVGTPASERHISTLGQSNPTIRPILRSLPVHEIQPYPARSENCIYPPTMSSVPNAASNQGGGRIPRPEIFSIGAMPHYSLLPPSSHKSNVPVFTERPLFMKTDCQMVPHASIDLVRAPSGQPLKTENIRALNQAGSIAVVERGLPVPLQCNEKKQDTLEEKRSMVINPTGSKVPTDDQAYEKSSYEKERFEPGQNSDGSYHTSALHYQASASHFLASASRPTPSSKNHPDRSKNVFSTALTMTPLKNMNKEHGVAQLSLPGFLSGNLARKPPTSSTRCKAELSFAKQSNMLPPGPTPKSSHQKTSCTPAFSGSADLSSARREVAIQAGREIVEGILAVATRGVDFTSMKLPSAGLPSEIPTNETTKHPESKHPSLKDTISGSRRYDVMQIDTILNHTRQDVLQPREEAQKAPMSKTDQEQTTEHGKHAGLSSHVVVPNAKFPGRNPIQGVSQEQPTPDKTSMEATLDSPLTFKQNEEKPLTRQLGRTLFLRQQQPRSPEPREIDPNTEEVVLVAEKRAVRRHGCRRGKSLKPVPMINVDASNPPVAESKDQSYAKSQAKRTPKRKMESRHSHFDQDDDGRLTKAIVFPDSGTPVSLADYEKKAHEHHEETKMALNPSKEGEADTSSAEPLASKTDMHDVDTLEVEFWKAMTTGIRGKPITVAYGVDVEAEGAFDSTEMSYVEWYGANPTGRKPNKRKKGRPRKQTVPNTAPRPRSSEHVPKQTVGSCADDPQNDADDELEYDDDSTLSKLAARRQMPHVGKQKLNAAESRSQRNKTMGPRSHVGTLNRDGLLRHLPRMPGINHSMYYVGQLFTRFCWHTEDAFLNSVSYLHPGSAEKVWYAVPPRYAPAFEEYAAANVFSPEILENESTGQALLMNKTTMFDPRRVRRKGVAVFRVVHKPGSFVLTAARAYHAGFNCGFNVAEAVNFANPTWFPVGRKASVFARQMYKPLCVPWEYLLFHEAKAMHDMDHGATERATPAERLMANAEVVARELKAIIMDGEIRIHRYAEESNCRVSMLHQIDGLTKYNQVGPEFGNGAGMVCSLCAHTCHFYAEMCGSCDDSFEARCVNHFGEGHRMCLNKDHKTVIVRRHDPVMLLDILGCLEKIARIEVSPREQSRRYVGYLRTWQTPLKSSGLRLRLDLKAAASRLPPKVAKEKGSREKVVREKVTRGKATRDKRRKIRKPRGMFPQAEVKSKQGMFPPQMEVLGDVKMISSVGAEQEKRSQGGFKLDEVVELTNNIPSLQ